MVVIVHALQRGHDAPLVRRWVLAGLVFSLAGDVALLWPKEGFLPGLVSFLLAHLAYLVAFTREPAPGGVAAGLRRLRGSGRLRSCGGCGPACPRRCRRRWWPTWCAWRRWRRRRPCCGAAARRAARVLALGGALFLASDALLATNKFAGPLPLASLWILGTYWSAQWCIASWLKPR